MQAALRILVIIPSRRALSGWRARQYHRVRTSMPASSGHVEELSPTEATRPTTSQAFTCPPANIAERLQYELWPLPSALCTSTWIGLHQTVRRCKHGNTLDATYAVSYTYMQRVPESQNWNKGIYADCLPPNHSQRHYASPTT